MNTVRHKIFRNFFILNKLKISKNQRNFDNIFGNIKFSKNKIFVDQNDLNCG